MSGNDTWLLYGVGRTGTLIAEAAVSRGHRPILGGRDPDTVRRLAERLDLPWVTGAATDLGHLIGDARLILLTAGPFAATAPAVLRTCLDANVHYLDIANEIPVAQAALAADDTARRRGVTVLPAVGFGTVASDGLARHVADQVPNATRLELAIVLATDGSSAGARASRMQALAGGGRVVRDGRLTRTRLGADAWRSHTPVGDRTLVAAPCADLIVSARTTGIPNITASVPVPMSLAAARLAMPMLPIVAGASRKMPRRTRPARSGDQRQNSDSYVWARATAGDGHTAEAWLHAGEGYAYTARAAILAVEATLGADALGATTVAKAFGSNLCFEAGGALIAADDAVSTGPTHGAGSKWR
jgi:short subunit dehydrogenase-like uncharacterized protein